VWILSHLTNRKDPHPLPINPFTQ